ncbi:MAG: CPBP family intramembrane glutamic endopeptidase [Planctomycetota bacterium]
MAAGGSCSRGLAFVALHWRYGNLAANHFAAGLALTWAYLRSGSIWVPVLLHFAGNLAVVLGAMALRLLT